VLQSTAAVALVAGYESISATFLNFIIAMIIYPDVQRKAQAELDAKIGRERLPDLSDKDELPYIVAVCKEILRWMPVTPLNVPHMPTIEDVYEGMRIPRGALVISNSWAMAHDERVYGPDHEDFRPERFLDTTVRDPRQFVFGFGRRICPGQYIAMDSIFLAIASILHAFKLEKAKDQSGAEIPVSPKWTPGLTAHLEPFSCAIVPRFEGVTGIIGRAME